jgi:hypothetical protein
VSLAELAELKVLKLPTFEGKALLDFFKLPRYKTGPLMQWKRGPVTDMEFIHSKGVDAYSNGFRIIRPVKAGNPGS